MNPEETTASEQDGLENQDIFTWPHRLYEQAMEDKSKVFDDLFQHMTPAMLAKHFDFLQKSAATGPEKSWWSKYQKNLADNLQSLSLKLFKGKYKPRIALKLDIPTGSYASQRFRTAAVEDNLVQHIVAEILEQIYEADFLNFSFSFRPKRSNYGATRALLKAIHRKKIDWILVAEVQDYFYSIDPKRLISFLKQRIGDPRIIQLIRKWLKDGVLEKFKLRSRAEKAKPGKRISGILANVYLHYVLDEWVQLWMQKEVKGAFIIVRANDAFAVGFQNEDEANLFLTQVEERLKHYKLTLCPDKTKLIEFGRFAEMRRVRRDEGKPETFDFLGYTHYCGTSEDGYFRVLQGKKVITKKSRRTRVILKRLAHKKKKKKD
ncbi:MAG: reverse transcriptase/maturase family protein [Deltaproteobacteria bacterium]|nr:reverse transcriptase/maturase family protein [Deltaproteobacteria bacterium]